VAHQHQGGSRGLGPTGEHGGAAAHLAHAARAAFEIGIEEGLDAVHQQEAGPHALGLLEDAADVCLGQQVDAGVLSAQALGPQLDLALALLAAGVEHGAR